MVCNKYDYWNFVKGIGAIAVVVGHVCPYGTNIIYSFHIALFFFVSGALYNEKKYGRHPELNFVNRLGKNWSKYMLYTTVICINSIVFNYFKVYSDTVNKLKLTDFLNYVLNSVTFNNTEMFCGAMWFVPAIIFASTILGFVIYYGNVVNDYFNKNYMKHVVIWLLGSVCALIGTQRMLSSNQLPMRMDVSLFIIPLMLAGYYFNRYANKFKQIKWYLGFFFIIIWLYLVVCRKYTFSIVSSQIISAPIFYMVSLLGVFSILFIAFYLMHISILKKIICVLGKYSFEIMALHFVCVKYVDCIYFYFLGKEDYEILRRFPCSNPDELWIIYIFVALVIPVCIGCLGEKLKKSNFAIKRVSIESDINDNYKSI